MNSGYQVLEEEKIAEVTAEYERWWTQRGDNFTGKLFELITKADHINAAKLASAFPYEVYVVARHQEKPILIRFSVGINGQIIYI